MSYNPPLYNTAFIIYASLEDAANPGKFKSSPTIAAGDFQVSVDGAAFANLTTLPTVTPSSSKLVKISLSATEMQGENIAILCSDASGGEWNDLLITLQTTTAQFDDIAERTARIDDNPASFDDVDGLGATLLSAIAAVDDNTMAHVVEGTTTFKQMIRLFASVLMGEASGGGTTTVTFRDLADTKNRVTLTVDSSGNRSAVTLDGT